MGLQQTEIIFRYKWPDGDKEIISKTDGRYKYEMFTPGGKGGGFLFLNDMAHVQAVIDQPRPVQ